MWSMPSSWATVDSEWAVMSCGTYAMLASRCNDPEVGSSCPVRTRSSVDLPLPLSPISPVTPRGMEPERPVKHSVPSGQVTVRSENVMSVCCEWGMRIS